MDLITVFKSKIRMYNPSFEITGLLTPEDLIYTFGTDTKVLSTVFEMLVEPFLKEIASESGFELYIPDKQNFYPDFTLMRNQYDSAKIAVDVKTTYRRFSRGKRTWSAKFTLGGFNSFIRNGSKNIAFPYASYSKHYVIGFIYTRKTDSETKVIKIEQRSSAPSCYSDVAWFIQEKYKISGETPGSGNTENIGSITGHSVDDFDRGDGPFSEYGEEVFHDYWRNYPKYRNSKKGYSNLSEYFKWRKSNTT